MTSQIHIDCRHYGDRVLGTARPVDINDHQESTERQRQLAVLQTTETPQQLKQVLSLVHNIDAGLSVKTASKAPLYAGADAGIEISSIPASSVSVERQYCEPGFSLMGKGRET